jgi:AcrR family transcriptional regulator
MPKIIDVEKKREEIMKEAIDVFAEKGYYNTTLSDIAERCGMGRTTLYQYFKNKDEIYCYTIDYITGAIENDYKSILKQPDLTVIEKIKLVAAKAIMEYDKEKAMMIVISDLLVRHRKENNELPNKLTDKISFLKDIFNHMIEEGMENEEIRPVNAQSMAFTLSSLVESFAIKAPLDRNIPIEDHLKSINVLVDGLKA